MANKKNKKANKPRPVASSAASENSNQELDTVDKETAKEKPAAQPKKEAKSSDKGKEKTVNKSKARAKDVSKAGKKPNIFKRFVEYLKQVRLEIKRTTWPTKNEVLNMTIIVLVALLFFGILIFILDFIMVELLNIFSTFAPESNAINPGAIDPGAIDLGAADTAGAEAGGGE